MVKHARGGRRCHEAGPQRGLCVGILLLLRLFLGLVLLFVLGRRLLLAAALLAGHLGRIPELLVYMDAERGRDGGRTA